MALPQLHSLRLGTVMMLKYFDAPQLRFLDIKLDGEDFAVTMLSELPSTLQTICVEIKCQHSTGDIPTASKFFRDLATLAVSRCLKSVDILCIVKDIDATMKAMTQAWILPSIKSALGQMRCLEKLHVSYGVFRLYRRAWDATVLTHLVSAKWKTARPLLDARLFAAEADEVARERRRGINEKLRSHVADV